MHIGVSKSGEWCLDAEAMRAMILGKVLWKRCFNCEKGLVWVDGEQGVEVPPKFLEENQTEEDQFRFYQDTCEDCHGVGFIFVVVED